MNMAKRILIVGLILSILTFIGFFIRERVLLQDEVLDGVRLRSHLLREKMVSARVIVSAMKETMVQNLILAKHEGYHHPELAAITYYPQYAVYGLEPTAAHTATVRIATLTGSGRFEKVDLETQIEVSAALTLDSTFHTAMKNLPELKWVYYTSAKGFIFVAPSVGVEGFQFNHELYQKEFWVSAAPQQNPARTMVISDVYEDAAGKGLMVTCSEPVWLNNKFYGIVSLDIGLDTMQAILGNGMHIPGESQIVDETSKLVAALNAFIPGDRMKLPDNLLQAENVQVSYEDSILIAMPLMEQHLWLIHRISKNNIMMKAMLRAIPYWLIVVFALTLAYLFMRLRESMKEVSRLATTDALTGTLNRRGFAFEATVLLAHCRRRGKAVCLLMLDVDHFKVVNDRYGHAAGDRVLKFVANTLRDMVRDEDIICRFGGEEFLLLFPETSLAQAEIVAERIRSYIETTVADVESNCQITVSIGCTQISEEEDLARAIGRGDNALYDAKNKGRNRVIALNFI
jgi:diguanylate cyclase (GGDEF)-like protein